MIDIILILAQLQPIINQPLPKKIGTCTQTFIKGIHHNVGSYIEYGNGGYQSSYDYVPEVHKSRPRDPVKLCLLFIPDCSMAKPGDERGKVYLTTNLRTRLKWELADSRHSCGGA